MNPDIAGRGPGKTGQDSEQRRFSRAVPAEERDKLAFPYRNAEVPQRRESPEVFGDPPHLNHGFQSGELTAKARRTRRSQSPLRVLCVFAVKTLGLFLP